MSQEFMHNRNINDILWLSEEDIESRPDKTEVYSQILSCVRNTSKDHLVMFHKKLLTRIFSIFVKIGKAEDSDIIYETIIYIIKMFNEVYSHYNQML